jgi:hypothetical protein
MKKFIPSGIPPLRDNKKGKWNGLSHFYITGFAGVSHDRQ